MPERERLAIIWNNFGPYHMARIQALKAHFDVIAIELASDQRLYRWWRGDVDESVQTLTSGAWEDQDKLRVAIELWRKLSQLRPRIILVPGWASLPALCAAIWGRTHRAKTLLMSESNFDDRARRFFAEALKRLWVSLMFDAGVVGGKRAASYLQLLGVPAARIGVGYDVVDNGYFFSSAMQCRQEAAESGNKRGTPYFLFVGRLAPEKNIATLLDAFDMYRDSGGAWALVIVGAGPLDWDLRGKAQRHIEIGTVVFAGHKMIHELPQYYADAGCFVLPSISEPWGLVVNEAMASGLPVIVSNACGCSDDLVEHEVNGFIVDPKNSTGLAAALTRMSSASEEERGEMRTNSLKIISNYSPERWVSEVRRITSETQRN
jgi:glycosyltransferase involved in cell wall biosynthesis